LPLTILHKHLAASAEQNGPRRRRSASQGVNKERAMRRLTKLLRCERGANAIEYALVATLISIAAIAAFHGLSNQIDIMYNNVSNHMH
jgi:pilus assembly protein Flp/PilA